MKVAVIGAGIIGVTTAYELSSDGHRVTVFERRGTVAAEASFANAGVIAPAFTAPWPSPGLPVKLFKEWLGQHSPVRLHADIRTLPWLWKWRGACDSRQHKLNTVRMQRLAGFSQDRLHAITQALRMDYERTSGYLLLLRTAREQAWLEPRLAALTESGMSFELLDAAQCRVIEPGLNAETALHAGVHFANDEAGNCREFAHLLRQEAQRLGTRFRFHTEVSDVIAGPQPRLVHRYAPPDENTLITVEETQRDVLDTQPLMHQTVEEGFDAVVVCAAMGSAKLLRPHGLRLPLQAVYGYSITAPARQHEGHTDIGPRAALMDERYQVTISRIGSRIRVAGITEVGGAPRKHHAGAIETLHKVLHDWFPGAARTNQAQPWKGARPMLPDGPPVLGSSGVEGVWLNLGHGGSGWALACGSARVLADAIAGRTPAIDTEGLGIERLKG